MKKIISAFLVLTLCLGSFTYFVSAQGPAGPIPTLSQQLQQLQQRYANGEISQELYEQGLEKIQWMQQLESGTAAVPASANYSASISIGGRHQQRTSYCCGPACAYMVAKYCNGGTAPNYDALHSYSGCHHGYDVYPGTIIQQLLVTFNHYQSRNNYMLLDASSVEEVEYTTYLGLNSYNAPPCYNIRGKSGPEYGNWPRGNYWDGGTEEYPVTHYVLGVGIDGEELSVCDPNGNVNPGTYYVTSSVMYNCLGLAEDADNTIGARAILY